MYLKLVHKSCTLHWLQQYWAVPWKMVKKLRPSDQRAGIILWRAPSVREILNQLILVNVSTRVLLLVVFVLEVVVVVVVVVEVVIVVVLEVILVVILIITALVMVVVLVEVV